MGNTNNSIVGLTYDFQNDIYYSELNYFNGWSESEIASGDKTWKTDQQNPSLTLMNDDAHIVWEGYNTEEDLHEVYYRKLTDGNVINMAVPPGSGGGHQNPIIVSGPTTANAYAPSIGAASNGDVAFFYQKNNCIYKKKKVGNTWWLYDYEEQGKYPSIISNGLKSSVITKYSSAPYILKSLYTEPFSNGNPILPYWIGGNYTESVVRFDYVIDSLQNGGQPGYITLDVCKVSFNRDTILLDDYFYSETMNVSNNMIPLELDLRVRFINVDQGFDDQETLLKVDFFENSDSLFLTSLKYHDLPAAAGDSVERFFKLATIVNLAGHSGQLRLRFAGIEPDVYFIHKESGNAPASKREIIKPQPETIIPKKFALHQNFPNPFNPITHITVDLPEEAQVKLSIYNIKGQKVKDVWSGNYNAGIYEVLFDGAGLASGIYIYRLQAIDKSGKIGNFTAVKRMLLMK